MVKRTVGRSLQVLKRQIKSLRRSTGERVGEIPPRRGLAIVLSLGVSFLLWFTVSMRGSYPLTVDLPTQVINIPQGRSLDELPPSSVRVQVHGEGWQLLRLFTNPQPVSIDASNETANLFEQATMDLPRELDVQAVTPTECEVRLGERIWTRIPIVFRGQVLPAVTHDTTEAIRMEPDSVTVSGALSIVRRLRAWPTEDKRVESVRAPLSIQVQLKDTLAGLVEVDQRETTLHAEIEQFTEIMREIEVQIPDLPPDIQGVSLEPKTISVKIRVPLSQAQDAEESQDIIATVSYLQIATDSVGSVEPTLHLPPGLASRRVQIHPPRLGYYMVVN